MFNNNSANGFSQKFLNRMFRKIDGLKWDLQGGGVGVVTQDGSIATLISVHNPAVEAVPAADNGTTGSAAIAAVAASTDYNISVNPFEAFGISIPAFATQVPFAAIKEGDLIVGDRDILGWVVGKTGAALKLLDFKGMRKTYQPPKVAILGQDGALVVQSLSGLFGGDAGVGGFAGQILPLLALTGGSDDSTLESILPLMLFSQMQTTNPAAAATAATVGGNTAIAASPMASLMPMLLMSKLGGKKKSGGSKKDGLFGGIDPMMLMMMGGFGGGAAGGMNPMMLLALGGLGNDDGDDTPELVSLPKTSAAQGFTPALQAIRR